jgi:hypothetical protein
MREKGGRTRRRREKGGRRKEGVGLSKGESLHLPFG